MLLPIIINSSAKKLVCYAVNELACYRGHLTTVSASKSDAVHNIYIGMLDPFPAQHFSPADYIALGQIHRAQL